MLPSSTWSHDLDVSSDSNNGGAPQNPHDWRGDYGHSNWDVRQGFVASLTDALPVLQNGSNKVCKQPLGGLQRNEIVTLQSGFPLNVTVWGDPANAGRSSDRPNLIGTASSDCGSGKLINCIDPSAFAAATYWYGDFARNTLSGAKVYNVDFLAFKNFRIVERSTLQFRFEFLNPLNTPALSNPNATFGASNVGTIAPQSTTIGRCSSR